MKSNDAIDIKNFQNQNSIETIFSEDEAKTDTRKLLMKNQRRKKHQPSTGIPCTRRLANTNETILIRSWKLPICPI